MVLVHIGHHIYDEGNFQQVFSIVRWLVSLPLDLIGHISHIREIGSHMLLKVKDDMIMEIISQILSCHVSHVGGGKVLLEHK